MNDKNTGDPFENVIKVSDVGEEYEYLRKKYRKNGKRI